MNDTTTQSAPIEVVVRDSSLGRVNSVVIQPDVTGDELLQHAVGAWKLPEDLDYIVRVVRLGRQIGLSQTMATLGVRQGDVLEIQTMADAGRH